MIDLHAHYFPPALVDEVKTHGRALGVELSAEGDALTFPAGPTRPLPPALLNLEGRTRSNSSEGIELQVLSPWMDALGDSLRSDLEVNWVRLMNDFTAETVQESSGFGAFAGLPVSSGEEAAKELRRGVDELGFAGGVLPTLVQKGDLDVAGLDPLFDEAVSLDVPLFIHPFRVMARDRLNDRFLWNICGNPYETTLAALRLYLSDTFVRWPDLRLLLSHCGGTLPFLAGRAWQGARTSKEIEIPVDTPDDILDAFYYDTVVHDAPALGFALKRIGPGRVALGTDAPFPMKIENVRAHVEDAVRWAGVDVAVVDDVLDAWPRNVLHGMNDKSGPRNLLRRDRSID